MYVSAAEEKISDSFWENGLENMYCIWNLQTQIDRGKYRYINIDSFLSPRLKKRHVMEAKNAQK